MTGHFASRRSAGANHAPAADHRLDQFAAQVTEARNTQPALQALAEIEQQFLDAALDVGGHLDRETVGAAWLILGQLFAANLANVAPEQQAQHLGRLLNVARLAGARLYTGDRLPVEVACPFMHGNGTPCGKVVKAPNPERADVLLGAHVWQAHPGETWPPKPEVHERSISPQDLGASELPPPPEGWHERTLTEPLATQHGRQYERDDDLFPPTVLGADPSFDQLQRFACVRVLALTKLGVDRKHGDPVTGVVGGLTPEAAWAEAEGEYEQILADRGGEQPLIVIAGDGGPGMFSDDTGRVWRAGAPRPKHAPHELCDCRPGEVYHCAAAANGEAQA